MALWKVRENTGVKPGDFGRFFCLRLVTVKYLNKEKKSIQNKTQNNKKNKKRVIFENLMEKSPYKPIGKFLLFFTMSNTLWLIPMSTRIWVGNLYDFFPTIKIGFYYRVQCYVIVNSAIMTEITRLVH